MRRGTGRVLLYKRPAAAAGGGGSVALTFKEAQNIDQTTTTTTLSMDTGTASSNRKCIAVIVTSNSYDSASYTAVSIGGVSCTLQQFVGSSASVGSFSGQIIFAWADVPSVSGAQNVVITGTDAANDRILVALYTLDKSLLVDGSPTFDTGGNNVTGATSNTVSANTGSGGFVIAALTLDYLLGTPGTSPSVTSSTDTMTTDAAHTTTGGRYGPIVTKKSGSTAATPFSVTFGWTTNSQAFAALMCWR